MATHFTRAQVLTGRIGVRPSAEYEVSVWVFVPSDFDTSDVKASVRGAHLDVGTYDQKGEVIDQIWTVAGLPELRQVTSTQGEWRRLSCTFDTVPAVATAVIRMGIADTGTAYFDDLALKEIGAKGTRDLIAEGDCAAIASALKRDLSLVAQAMQDCRLQPVREVRPLKGNMPCVAVLIPDGQLVKRVECMGEVADR